MRWKYVICYMSVKSKLCNAFVRISDLCNFYHHRLATNAEWETQKKWVLKILKKFILKIAPLPTKATVFWVFLKDFSLIVSYHHIYKYSYKFTFTRNTWSIYGKGNKKEKVGMPSQIVRPSIRKKKRQVGYASTYIKLKHWEKKWKENSCKFLKRK